MQHINTKAMKRSVSTMSETLTYSRDHEQEREIVSILLDSALYLDMDLATRCRLLHFIETSYFESSAR